MPKVATTLSQRLKSAGLKPKPTRKSPLWSGPESDSPAGGITNSLLSRYLACPYRFSIKVIDGLGPVDQFNKSIEYGNMWHVCEECLANEMDWRENLQAYAKSLCNKYRNDQLDIERWYQICKAQFPIYVDYWSKHPDVKERTPLLQEQVFNVPYQLPSGRMVYLRGKWDAVDLIGKGKDAKVMIQENKSKGDIDAESLQRQLLFDLQTMLYTTALWEQLHNYDCASNSLFGRDYGQVRGVRYNVIRRPLAGGKHTISQWQPSKKNPAGETPAEFYARLGGLIQSDPGHFFMRWKVEITQSDIDRFKREFLNPCLENVCDDYEWWKHCLEYGDDRFDYMKRENTIPAQQRTYRLPYGCYSSLYDGGSDPVDDFITTGSMVGLQQVDDLFPELR